MKKPLIGADLILSLGFIAYLYFDIKSDEGGRTDLHLVGV